MATKRRIKVSDENYEITVKESIESFIESKMADNLAEISIRTYKYGIKQFMDFADYPDGYALKDIEEADIIHWKNRLLTTDLSYNTVNNYVRGVRTWLDWCYKKGMINKKFEIKEVRGQDTRIKYYTEDEMAALLEKPIGNNNFGAWRSWAIISFIYATGARAQSVCDVMMDDIDFFHKEITFRHQKNKSILVSPLSEQLEKVLKEYIKRCGLSGEDYLFPSINGDKLGTHNLNTMINRYCDSREVPRRGVHAIRHAFASQYIRNGGNPAKLQKLLNHSSFSMTERYLHLFGEDLKVDFNDFSPLDIATRKKSRTRRVGK